MSRNADSPRASERTSQTVCPCAKRNPAIPKEILSLTPRFSGVIPGQRRSSTASAVSQSPEKPLKRFWTSSDVPTPLKRGVNERREPQRATPHCVIASGETTRLRSLLAFTLVELLVVIAIMGLLAALLLPGLGRAKESGRAAACLSNLHQIGLALQLYVQDNNNRLPYTRDKSLTTTNELPSPDMVLSNYLANLQVLRCPSDKQQVFETTGSSYYWNNLLNGQDADHLSAFGIGFAPHQIPLFCDKDKFHAARGPKKEVNYLYADGHLKNLLVMEGTIQTVP
jgi:prepilin-type N-terminal cleavage/methylation domain-containing protein/prepilin-type processing-associated H-X9-DG protein